MYWLNLSTQEETIPFPCMIFPSFLSHIFNVSPQAGIWWYNGQETEEYNIFIIKAGLVVRMPSNPRAEQHF